MYLSFGKPAEKSRAIMVDAEGGDRSEFRTGRLGTQAEP